MSLAKRTLSVLLACAMVMTSTPVPALAKGNPVDDLVVLEVLEDDVEDEAAAFESTDEESASLGAEEERAEEAVEVLDDASAEEEATVSEPSDQDEVMPADEPSLPGGIVADVAQDGGDALFAQSTDSYNKGHEVAWTALGLFQYIMQNTTVGSAEYEDAKLAYDIMKGNDSLHSVDVASALNLSAEGCPASLVNIKASLAYIDEYNALRARENREEGIHLSTNVGTNCTMLAISIVQCAYSARDVAYSHSMAFNVGENLAWGYDPDSSVFSDPFEGWYEKEKGYFKGTIPIPAGCGWGHYENIVSPSTTATGFAQSFDDAMYGSCHEQSFDGDNFSDVVYTTKEFRSKWFNRYYAAKSAEGMGIHFEDVSKSHWGYKMICEAVGSDFMSGYDKWTFGPDDNVTRGQVATILWNMEGKPSRSGKSFSDVANGKFYSKAVAWASAVGVVSGYGNGKFGPNDKVTREQLAAMLRNYANYKGLNMAGSGSSSYSSMKDKGKVSGWATQSVGWCFSHKLLTGTSDGKIMPQGNATRAQVAKMVVMLSKL